MLGKRPRAVLAVAASPFVKSRQSRQSPLPPLPQARVALAYAQAAVAALLESGLVPPPLPDPLSLSQYLALLAQGQAARADFGLLVGQRMRSASFVAYGQVVLASRSFAEAFVQTQRFESLAHDLGRSELVVEDGVAHYLWHSPWLEQGAGLALPLSVMVGIHGFAQWLHQGPLPLRALALPGAEPEPQAAARIAQVLGLRPRYGAETTCASFDAALLQAPIASHDPALLPLLEQHAARLLAAREQALAASGLADAVSLQLRELLPRGESRLEAVAQALRLSPRTLQRRLGQCGQPFQQLLDATRRELADAYLRDASLSLTEIAFLLGYSEHSSFTHAHRAWHGESPQARRAWLLRLVRT